MTLYTGWISFDPKTETTEAARKFLTSLGIAVGVLRATPSADTFEGCVATTDQINLLDPHFGRFIWGMEPMEGGA